MAVYLFDLFITNVFSTPFSLNTPPGTKVKLVGTIQVKNGILLLDDSNIHVLGGEVDHMVEKWELQRVRVNLSLNYYTSSCLKTIQKLPLFASIVLPGLLLVFWFSVYPSTCRVWPNTAGVTLEQKVDLHPSCHLVR